MYSSWGNYPRQSATVVQPTTETAVLAALREARSVLPYGNGRSQGDSCLNEAGLLLDMRRLNHVVAFDQAAGVIRCEAGITLAELLTILVPRGWFFPVTPGTKYVTVGGAIANDVHGKNHETAATFGNHVRRFSLVRSTGESVVCSPEENTELWRATIGGLGLTGVITWAEVQLRRLPSQWITEKVIPLRNLEDFFVADTTGFEYSVAWVDCLAQGQKLGQGHLLVGNHTSAGAAVSAPDADLLHPRLTVPIMAPNWLINHASVKIFNGR